jgi:cobalt/nickel transport system permease protein
MHLIEGTLNSSTTILTSAAGIMALGTACYAWRRERSLKQLPALAAMTGFVFLAQALNCATGFGFSGHMIGAALLAILFGPCSAMLSMALILSAQVGFLGDGSFSTLGANYLNMGVIAPWSAYLAFRALQGRRAPQVDAGQVFAMGCAAFLSTIAVSVSLSYMVGGQLSAFLYTHSLIGGIEALMSVAAFVLFVRGLNMRPSERHSFALKPIAGACLVALCLSPFSSPQPDGLQYVLEASTAEVD